MKKAISTTGFLATGVACASLAMMAASAPAHAFQPEDEPFAFNFRYDRTELESTDTATRMLSRLERQVRDYCGESTRTRLQNAKLVRTCVDATIKDTVSKIGSETLAEAYETRSAG